MKKLFFLAIGATFCSIVSTYATPKTLWLIGDAAMAHYTDSTLAYGWGTAFEQYVNNRIDIVNMAGPSISATFFDDNNTIKKIEELQKKSYILIQLGTNDLREDIPSQYSSSETFALRLNKIISTAHKNKINIILCTPLAQPYYKDGLLINRLGVYPDIIRRVATYNHVLLLDLEALTRNWLNEMTEEQAAAYYVTLDRRQLVNGEYQLNKEGAEVVAKMAKAAILNSESKLKKEIIK